VAGHELADGLDDLRAPHEGLARGVVGDEVEVALAVFLLLVGQAVEFLRQRAQRFDSRRIDLAWMVSSPLLVLNSVPVTPMKSPGPSA